MKTANRGSTAIYTLWLAMTLGAGAAVGCSGTVSDPDLPGGSPTGGATTGTGGGGRGVGAGGAGGAGGASGTVTGTGGGAGTSGPGALKCDTPAVGPTPLRRLTHAEYDNSVADLLGMTLTPTARPSADFPPDTQVGIFDNSAEAQTIPSLLAEEYLDASVKLAQGVTDMRTLAGCDVTVAATAPTCVRTFIQRFGRRAFRRPLTDAEVTKLFTVYDTARAASDTTTGVRAVIAATLASPNFLYRPEFGAAASKVPGAMQASPFEIAGRLGSLIWASVPDDVLLDEAQAGRLATKEQVATQVRRMIANPKSHVAIASFYDQWLGLGMLDTATKDKAVFPKFDDTLRAAMREETRRFVDNVLWQDDAKLTTLLQAPYSFVNGPLATLYGVKNGPTSATTFAKVALDPTQRSGILTQASMLTAFARPDESSPVKRGKWVRTRMLCMDLPDPPNNVPELPPVTAGQSNRERFRQHTDNAACSGCHHLIDGLGFGLEHYDGIGQFRTTDQGVAVDSAGEVTATDDIDGAYDGGPALAAMLAKSGQVRDCAPTQWLRYAMARREDADDSCALGAVRQAFATSGGNLSELVIALTQTDAFLSYRQPK
jgi:hypothetical protein